MNQLHQHINHGTRHNGYASGRCAAKDENKP